MNERVKELLNELGVVVNQTIAESEKVARLIARIRAENYDVVLALETTVNCKAPSEVKSEPKAQVPARAQRRTLTADDIEFLRSLRIKVDEMY